MRLQRPVLGLVVAVATVGMAAAQTSGALRWRAPSASLGLQAGSADGRLPCSSYTLSCSEATAVPLYSSATAPRSLSMQLSAAEQAALATQMWEKTGDTLLVVEPGTPAGYARIIALRGQLIAQGAHVAAPCPHDGKCPLEAPDWCHFSQRLQRSRAHMQVKGAELPFEDERFAYVALTRARIEKRPARVLAQPEVTKAAVVTKLCTTDGLVFATVPRRDKAAYHRARKQRWGETSETGTREIN